MPTNQGKALPPRMWIRVESDVVAHPNFEKHNSHTLAFFTQRAPDQMQYIPLAEVLPLLDTLLEARSYIPALYQQAHGRAWPANSSLKKQIAEALKNFKDGGV